MPLEIEELVIRAKVNEGACGDDKEGAATQEDKYSMIQECVKEVLRVLESKKKP